MASRAKKVPASSAKVAASSRKVTEEIAEQAPSDDFGDNQIEEATEIDEGEEQVNEGDNEEVYEGEDEEVNEGEEETEQADWQQSPTGDDDNNPTEGFEMDTSEERGEEEGDEEVVEGDEEVVEGDEEVVEGDEEVVEGEDEVGEGEDEEEVVEGEEEVIEGEEAVVEGEEEVVEGNERVIEDDEEAVEDEEEVVDGDGEVIEVDDDVMEGDEERGEGDEEVMEGDEEIVEGDKEVVEGEVEVIEGDEEVIEDEEKVDKPGVETEQADCQPLLTDNATTTAETKSTVLKAGNVPPTSQSNTNIEVIDLCDETDDDMAKRIVKKRARCIKFEEARKRRHVEEALARKQLYQVFAAGGTGPDPVTVKKPTTGTATVKNPMTGTATAKKPTTGTVTVKKPTTGTATVKKPNAFNGPVIARPKSKIKPKDRIYEKFAVLDRSHPAGKILFQFHTPFLTAWNRAIGRMIQIEKVPIIFKFGSGRFQSDVFIFLLSTESPLPKLQEVLKSLPEIWPGAKLEIVNEANIPKLVATVTFYITGRLVEQNTDVILQLLAKQNKNLHVDQWYVYSREEITDGSLIFADVDRASLTHLYKTKGHAYLLNNVVRFRLGHQPAGKVDPLTWRWDSNQFKYQRQ